jgi:hypothetical protein
MQAGKGLSGLESHGGTRTGGSQKGNENIERTLSERSHAHSREPRMHGRIRGVASGHPVARAVLYSNAMTETAEAVSGGPVRRANVPPRSRRAGTGQAFSTVS